MKTIVKVKNILALFYMLLTFAACEKLNLSDPGNLVPLTADQDPVLPSIRVNGTLLHSETFGDPSGPMIVTIHGGPGSDYRSMLTCRELAKEGYYVVFYDQRGSGLSQRHDAHEGVFTTQQYIDDLDAVLSYYQSTSDQRIILLGHSWGAMLAAGYVDQYPDRIHGLLLSEPGGFTFKQTMDYVRRSQSPEFFGEGTNDYVFQEHFISGEAHEVLDYKMLIADRAGGGGQTPCWRFGAVCNAEMLSYARRYDFDFTANLDKYTRPVLFAYSELNEAYGIDHALLVSSAFPNVRLIKIKGCGHPIPALGWESYYPEVKRYLNEILKK